MTRVGVAVLFVLLVGCGKKAKTTEDDTATYRRAMDMLAASLEKDIEKWSETEFATQAEAAEAMFNLTPANTDQTKRGAKILSELGWTQEKLVKFGIDHPEVVTEVGEAFDRRLSGALAAVRPRMKELAKLPPGDINAVRARAISKLPKDAPARKQLLTEWTPVVSLAELQTTAAAAAKEKRPVVVHVRAVWAMPALEIEKSLFSTPEFRKLVASFQLISIDVTDATAEHAKLQKTLGVDSLPAVLFYQDADVLVQATPAAPAKPGLALRKLDDIKKFKDGLQGLSR